MKKIGKSALKTKPSSTSSTPNFNEDHIEMFEWIAKKSHDQETQVTNGRIFREFGISRPQGLRGSAEEDDEVGMIFILIEL